MRRVLKDEAIRDWLRGRVQRGFERCSSTVGLSVMYRMGYRFECLVA